MHILKVATHVRRQNLVHVMQAMTTKRRGQRRHLQLHVGLGAEGGDCCDGHSCDGRWRRRPIAAASAALAVAALHRRCHHHWFICPHQPALFWQPTDSPPSSTCQQLVEQQPADHNLPTDSSPPTSS